MAGSTESGPRTRRTYASEDQEWNYSEDLDAEFLCQFHECWAQLEEEIGSLQDKKKAMLANVRSRYGRHRAEALKIGMRLMLMDPRQRAEQLRFNEVARRYVETLEAEIAERRFDA